MKTRYLAERKGGIMWCLQASLNSMINLCASER